MSEQDKPQLINIDNLTYNIADLSDTCKEMLGDTQTANQGIQLLASLLNNAKAGSDAKFKEACKLLPDPVESEELTGEIADKAH